MTPAQSARVAQIATVAAIFAILMGAMTLLAGVDYVYGFFFLPHAILIGSSTIPTSVLTRAVVAWDAGRAAQMDEDEIRARLDLAAAAVAAAEAEKRPDAAGETVTVMLPRFAEARSHGEILRGAALRLVWRRADGSRARPADEAAAVDLAARLVFRDDPAGHGFARARLRARQPMQATEPIETPSAHARLRLKALMAELAR